MMDPYELRRSDFALDDALEAIQDAFASLLAKECPTSVVRAAEPVGYAAPLWHKVAALGALSMGVPEDAGGDGAGLVALAVVAEELGRSLAPIPLLEHVVASRLLAAARTPTAQELVEEAMSGAGLFGLALTPLAGPQLVSSAAVADRVVALDGSRLVVLRREGRAHVPNQSSLPMAWVEPGAEEVTVLLEDADSIFATAQREWKILTAAALTGMTEGALALALDFVKTRRTLGVVIATLQGVSFPLADVQIGVTGARNLYRRAAWFHDQQPEHEPWLPYAALAYATQVATHGVTAAQHAQGGLGFTVEADSSLYFLRAKGWALAGGDPGNDVSQVGRLVLAAAAS